MNGADVYYWFMEGFGNMKHLQDPHLGSIDVPIIHAIVSFVVQEYFCYRIWTLDRRLWMLCLVITMVRGLSLFHPHPPDSGLLHQAFNPSIVRIDMGGGQGKYCAMLLRRPSI